MDGVPVDGAGVADVGLALGLGPVAGERGGALHGCALRREAVHRVRQPHGRGAFAGGVLGPQPRLVDLNQPRLGARLTDEQPHRVLLRVDGVDDRDLPVLDALGPRAVGARRERVGGVADRDDVAGSQ